MSTVHKVNRNHSHNGKRKHAVELDGTNLRDVAMDVGHEVRRWAKDKGESALELLDPVENFVERNPMKAILIAAGVGMICGALFFRRS